MSLLKFYLTEEKEPRLPHTIPPMELDRLICGFLLAVRKKDGSEYEPSSIRGFVSSIERYLRQSSYPLSILKDMQFSRNRDVLKSKQKQLKGIGKGNKPMAADEITDNEINQLYDCKVLGTDNPTTSLTNSMWLICTTHFGMRTGKETHDLLWGDVELKTDTKSGEEYLMYSQERQTKTRTGANARDVRVIKPRAYVMPSEPDKDPVGLYKLYSEKRPVVKSNYNWYKACPMGVNKMYSIMKDMKKSSGLESDRHLTNYSVRKHLIQKLSDSGVPPNQIIQISGHKNLNSLHNYSKLNPDQNKHISNILSTTSNPPKNVNMAPVLVSASRTNSSIPAATGGPCQTYPTPSYRAEGLFTGNPVFNAPVSFHFHQHMQANSSLQVVVTSCESVHDGPAAWLGQLSQPNSPVVKNRIIA